MINCPENEKEPEIQIGNPTDVKHVAHIGNDGPFNNAPSWVWLIVFIMAYYVMVLLTKIFDNSFVALLTIFFWQTFFISI